MDDGKCNLGISTIDIEILVELWICVVENMICKYSLMNEMFLFSWMNILNYPYQIRNVVINLRWMDIIDYPCWLPFNHEDDFNVCFLLRSILGQQGEKLDVRVLKWSVFSSSKLGLTSPMIKEVLLNKT